MIDVAPVAPLEGPIFEGILKDAVGEMFDPGEDYGDTGMIDPDATVDAPIEPDPVNNR